MKNTFLCCVLFALFLPGAITLRWNPNTENDLAGYHLYYGYQSSRYIKKIDVGAYTTHVLNDLQSDTDYFFSVTAYDTAGNESAYSKEITVHTEIDKNKEIETNVIIDGKNFPNPFNPIRESTSLHYSLSKSATVTLKIFNIKGELIRTILENRYKIEGQHHEDSWDGRDDNGLYVQNGSYFCEIRASSQHHYLKIALVK
ncbi:fibronectin type III domain-containing protein [candidate division KSB1 bacterium]|nr:fibronectin type III domain-containing protein [candidate division KSB1 bacterium]